MIARLATFRVLALPPAAAFRFTRKTEKDFGIGVGTCHIRN
jgi:hypothetical protein